MADATAKILEDGVANSYKYINSYQNKFIVCFIYYFVDIKIQYTVFGYLSHVVLDGFL